MTIENIYWFVGGCAIGLGTAVFSIRMIVTNIIEETQKRSS